MKKSNPNYQRMVTPYFDKVKAKKQPVRIIPVPTAFRKVEKAA